MDKVNRAPRRRVKNMVKAGDLPFVAEFAREIALCKTPETPPPEAELGHALEGLREAVEQRESQQEPPAATAEIPDPPVGQLDLWPEPQRGSPNTFLRSALFSAIQSEHRKQLEQKPAKATENTLPVAIVSQAGTTIAYKGKQLDQFDLDVWLQAIHFARCQPLGNDCFFRGSDFLKAIGIKGDGKTAYDLLDEALNRLTDGTIVINQRDVTFRGHLIASYVRGDRNRLYKISFSEEIIKLFGWSSWTALQWQERRKLKGRALELWLHGFYSSHAQPYPLTVEYLHKLCGSTTQQIKHFKANLKKAFARLEEVAGIKAAFDGNTVHVDRLPSPAQAKHLVQHKKFGNPPSTAKH